MGIDVTAEVRIERPREEVATFVMDPANDMSWIGGIKEARILTTPPVGAGTRVARVAGFLGRRIEYVNEIKVFDKGKRLVMQSIKGPFPMHITYDFEDAVGGAAAVRLRIQGEASGFFKLATPLLAGQVRKSIFADLGRLKKVMEEDGASAAAQ